MIGDQSRLLKPLDRVCWGVTTTDLGTVIETDWAGVSINWDNGHTTSIQHNDMAQVERVLNWSRLSEQKFRVDKWSLCRG